MHQPKAMQYIATVHTMYPFHCSFISLSRIKIQTVFSEVEITVRTHLSSLPHLTMFRLSLTLIGSYPPR